MEKQVMKNEVIEISALLGYVKANLFFQQEAFNNITKMADTKNINEALVTCYELNRISRHFDTQFNQVDNLLDEIGEKIEAIEVALLNDGSSK